MTAHDCEHEWIVDDGDPYRCTAPATGKWLGHWYCQEHLDERMDAGKRSPGSAMMAESDTFL